MGKMDLVSKLGCETNLPKIEKDIRAPDVTVEKCSDSS
jgi:hypothetical protein